ncbi:MAG: CARDB domain-containing protein [Minisyncoccia bacterium]|jgi:hypothetical protein
MDRTNTQIRSKTLTGLAVVGFIALVTAGIWLAVYSTRFVPIVVNHAGTAAVYLGSFFTRESTSHLSIVSTPIAPTTISFGDASSTASTNIAPKHPTPSPKPTKTVAGTKTDTIYQISGATSTPAFFGLPDFIVNINAVGYLESASADSFVASSTVPAGSRPAVSFTIKNIGTNASGAWRFSASIPTQTAYIYQSQPQQSLNPGDSIDYVLGFDQANRGVNEMISVTANFDHAVEESNTNNNSASATVTILGS